MFARCFCATPTPCVRFFAFASHALTLALSPLFRSSFAAVLYLSRSRLASRSSFAFRPHLASRFLFRLVLVLIAPYLCAPLRSLLQTADRSEGKKLSIGDSPKQLIRRIIRELSPERDFNPNNAPFAVEIQPYTLEARLFFPDSNRAVVTNRGFFVQNAPYTLQMPCVARFYMDCAVPGACPLFRMCLWTYLFLSRL